MAPLPKSTTRKHTVFLLSLFSSLFTSFALFTYFMLLPFSQFTTHQKVSSKHYQPVDIDALQASSRVVKFAHDDAYQSLDREHDDLWHDKLLPPNGGYFTSVHGDKNNTAPTLGIAMFHQLQCLATIRSEMQYLDRVAAGRTDPERASSDPPVLHNRDRALACFDYLRQSLLCMADATAELPSQSDKGTGLIDGMGERQCRDWHVLYEASEPGLSDDLR